MANYQIANNKIEGDQLSAEEWNEAANAIIELLNKCPSVNTNKDTLIAPNGKEYSLIHIDSRIYIDVVNSILHYNGDDGHEYLYDLTPHDSGSSDVDYIVYNIKNINFYYDKAKWYGETLYPNLSYVLEKTTYYVNGTFRKTQGTYNTSIDNLTQISYSGTGIDSITGRIIVPATDSTYHDDHIVGSSTVTIRLNNNDYGGTLYTDSTQIIQEGHDGGEPEDPTIVTKSYSSVEIDTFVYPKVSYRGGTVAPVLQYRMIGYNYMSDGTMEQFTEVHTREGDMANPSLVADISVTYDGENVDQVTGSITVSESRITSDHLITNVAVHIESLIEGDMCSGTDSTSVIQNKYTPSILYFKGCSENPPEIYNDLGNSFEFPNNDSLQVSLGEEARTYWVAIPTDTLEITDWRDTALNTPLTYSEGSTITIDGIDYTVYYYKSVLTMANNPHYVTISKL